MSFNKIVKRDHNSQMSSVAGCLPLPEMAMLDVLFQSVRKHHHHSSSDRERLLSHIHNIYIAVIIVHVLLNMKKGNTNKGNYCFLQL